MSGAIQRVLVADDSLTIATALSLILRRAEFEVTTAGSGEEALRIAATEHFDLIVSDQQMLEISGIELCQRLRQTERYRDTPFVLLTARTELDVDWRAAGVTSVEGKPFRGSEIVKLAQQLTTGSRV